MQRTAILGFGNPVRQDDGVGCFVIEQLRARLGDPPGLTLLDMGTSAFEVLFQLKGHDRIILVDAVLNSGEPDGTLFCLPASEVEGAIQEDPMVFLHALKWDQALSYAKKILREEYPEDIEVYLVAITHSRLEIGLSEAVESAGKELIDRLLKNELSAFCSAEARIA